MNGGSIDVADLRFSHWELVSLDSAEDQTPDLALVAVEPLGDDPANPGLQFRANGQFATTGLNTLDLVLRFQVAARTPGQLITGQTLNLTEYSFSDNFGILFISEELADPAAANLGSGLVSVNNEFQDLMLTNTVEFPPQPVVISTKNIFVTGLPGAGTSAVHEFSQRFSVVPEPGGLLPVLTALSAWHSLRRNRTVIAA